MTANPHRVRWIVADPDTGAVIAPEFAVTIDLDRLTADQIERATDAAELDDIPADVLAESVSLAALLADGLRWRAWLATPYNADATRGDSWQAPATVPCASCRLAGDGYTAVDVRTAVVIPWDVMGDPRSYALVCPECAEVTPEPAPVPTCDNCQTAGPDLWFRYRHSNMADGLELIETLCEACYNADVIPLSVTHMLLDAVEDGDLDAIADIVAVHGFDENAEEVEA